MAGNVGRTAAVVALALALAVGATKIAAREMQSRRHAGFHVLGAPGGGIDCRDMTANLRTESGSWRVFYTSYAMGFITGANFVSYADDGRNSNVGFDIPADVIFPSIEHYCGQNPSKRIAEAVATVYSQLAASGDDPAIR